MPDFLRWATILVFVYASPMKRLTFGMLKVTAYLFLHPTNCFTNYRHRDPPIQTPYLRNINWHTTPSLPTKCVPWCTASTYARRGRVPIGKWCVSPFARHPHFVTRCDSELAIIIDDPRAHSGPSAPILQKYNDERIEAINLQISLAEAKEATSAGRAMSEEALRKRKTREQRKELERAKAAATADSTEGPTSLFVPESSAHTNEPSIVPPTSTTPAYTVKVPSSSSSLPWYTSQTSTYTTLASARTACVWTYPSTLHERAKCGVFRGLWGKGYFMGGGIKFGGDYLVYPGSYPAF